MDKHCVQGEYPHATSPWDWRAYLWVPVTFAEWITAIALLVFLMYLVREYVIPVLKGCVRCRGSVLQAVDTAKSFLACVLPT